MSIIQQTNYLYNPRATITWKYQYLNYIKISYYGNTITTASTIISEKLFSNSYTTPDLSLNTLYTFVLTLYNSADTSSYSKTLLLDTTYSIKNAYIVNSTSTYVDLQWSGIYYYVKIFGKRVSDISYNDLSINITQSPYSYSGLDGNTDYTFYITPYNINNNIGLSTDNMTVKTKVQAAKNLITTYVDNSSAIISFSYPTNYNISTLYTLSVINTDIYNKIDVSSLISPIQANQLTGNTNYRISIITTLNNDNTLTATSDYITALTGVQPPTNLNTVFYDNSAIQLAFIDGSNTYNSVYYTVTATNSANNIILNVSGTSIPIILSNLSGNTIYTMFVKNTLNGNLTLEAYSPSISTTTTVQPVSDISTVFVDGSAIAISFDGAKNTYSSRNIIINTTDICGEIINIITDASAGSTTSNLFSGLSGNTQYFFKVNTTLNGNTYLTASADVYTMRTYVQEPTNISIPFYDSSSIDISFIFPVNTYTTSYFYNVYVTDNINMTDVSGINNLFMIQDLSSSTNYNYYIRTYVISKSDIITITTANRAFVPDPIFYAVNFT